jgi:hypothetical protein
VFGDLGRIWQVQNGNDAFLKAMLQRNSFAYMSFWNTRYGGMRVATRDGPNLAYPTAVVANFGQLEREAHGESS